MSEMTDISFTLSGRELAADHALQLWREVVRILPWLEAEAGAGILPLRAPGVSGPLILSRRSRMLMRVPAHRAQEASALAGHTLDVGGHVLTVGEARERPLQPAPTLHAQLVASEEEETLFMEKMAAELEALGVSGKLICGKRLTLGGPEGTITGYSLVVHELKPDASLRLQYAGMGGARGIGCGIFIPYKVIANLDGETG